MAQEADTRSTEQRAAHAALCADLLRNSTPPEGTREELYCEGTYDTWLCWPHTPANTTAYQHCPDFILGFRSELYAHKKCTENGSWYRNPNTGNPWSNYTACVPTDDAAVCLGRYYNCGGTSFYTWAIAVTNMFRLGVKSFIPITNIFSCLIKLKLSKWLRPDVSEIITVYEIGYSISLIALLLSLGILAYLKSLRCARITVHMNLFVSFAANNALWLVWYALVVRDPDTAAASPGWCRALQAALQYALLTNYTWMLCEGLYLHTVLVRAFVSERRLLRALLAAGWLLPVPFIAAFVARKAIAEAPYCWMDEGAPGVELALLVCCAVLLNLAFLCNIVRVLCTKLRAGASAGTARPSRTALHALRATCLLAPLLGLQYLLTPFRPARDVSWWLAYEYVTALTTSLQGLCVAVLYCFCNGEVLAQLRRRWRVLVFRPRANSTTNTTVSFVRSGAPGAGEDKV